jgi:hypothetical protein
VGERERERERKKESFLSREEIPARQIRLRWSRLGVGGAGVGWGFSWGQGLWFRVSVQGVTRSRAKYIG